MKEDGSRAISGKMQDSLTKVCPEAFLSPEIISVSPEIISVYLNQ
jgi:hypothetical protein